MITAGEIALDLILPSILISSSILIYQFENSIKSNFFGDSKEEEQQTKSIQSHIFKAKTSHARFLPKKSKHIFSYPVLFIGVNLKSLENDELNLNRWFSWNPSNWCLTSLRPEGYLDLPPSSSSTTTTTGNDELKVIGIRERLWKRLELRGIDKSRAELVYMVTMPAYLGLEGINPLTVHFCYKENEFGIRSELEIVVLEVHNTFGERHIYILETGVAEDDKVPDSWQHRWTFPRAFHVSPFNDRKGFYRVSLDDPLKSTADSPAATSLPTSPNLNLKIIYLTPSSTSPEILEKKIYASLSGPSVPLTPSSILTSVLKLPFSLLLTTPRILYQAMLLHYTKELNVFPRPEPLAQFKELEFQDLDLKLNPVEKGGLKGSVGWQSEGSNEVFARIKLEDYLKEKVKEKKIKVVIRSSDDSVSDVIISSDTSDDITEQEHSTEEKILTISYLTPMFYTDLLLAPSIPLALSLNNKVSHRWKTNNDSLFLSLFESNSNPPSPIPFFDKITNNLRIQLLSAIIPFPSTSSALPLTIPNHPLNDNSISLVLFLVSNYFWLKFGFGIFWLTGAKFVEGSETWAEWNRWRVLMEKEKDV